MSPSRDATLAAMIGLLMPLALLAWLFHWQITPPATRAGFRLSLVFVAASSPRVAVLPRRSTARRPLQRAHHTTAADVGSQPARPALPVAQEDSSPPIHRPLDLGVRPDSAASFASSTQANILRNEAPMPAEAPPKINLVLHDGSLVARLIGGQHAGICAELLNKLRAAGPGPSSEVILQSLKRRQCRT